MNARQMVQAIVASDKYNDVERKHAIYQILVELAVIKARGSRTPHYADAVELASKLCGVQLNTIMRQQLIHSVQYVLLLGLCTKGNPRADADDLDRVLKHARENLAL